MEQKIFTLLTVTFLLITTAFSAYHYFPVGVDECGSDCQTWLTPVNPSPDACTTVCVEKPEPHPLYLPSLYLSVLTGLTTVFYTVLLVKTKVLDRKLEGSNRL